MVHVNPGFQKLRYQKLRRGYGESRISEEGTVNPGFQKRVR
jgi:hypothetical protein